MQVDVKRISGFDQCFRAMYMSKRTWTPELDEEITRVCNAVLNKNGFVDPNANKKDIEQFNKWLSMALKMGKRHITVLRYIDIFLMTEGMHRGGQDDIDSHAMRFDNRIIRSSTRLATFGNEKSDYYKDKIITTDEALKILNIDLPDSIMISGKEYIKTVNGYIEKQYENNKDVKRGLYMLSIPSNFVSTINLTEWSHVYKERNKKGTANPEVKEWAESVMNQLTIKYPSITRELVLSIQN